MTSGGSMGLGEIGLNYQAITADETGAFQRHLGLMVEDKRAQALALAYQNPKKAIEDYQSLRQDIDEEAAKMVKKTGAELMLAGFSKDEAFAYAMDDAKYFHARKVRLLDITNPGGSSAEAAIALSSGAKRKDLVVKPE